MKDISPTAEKIDFKAILCTIPLDEGAERNVGEIPWPPNIAIVSLMQQMSKRGYKGEVYNIDLILPSDKEVYEYFNINKPAVVGLSAVVSTMYSRIKNISKIIRQASPLTVIVVGGNMAVSASLILNNTEADICVLGDGEYPWLSILDYLKNSGGIIKKSDLLNIKGIAFLNDVGEMEFTGYGDPIPNEENSYPDYELLSNSRPELRNNYFREGKECAWFNHDIRSFDADRKPKLASLWTNRGCVARCTFCQRFIKGYMSYDLLKLDAHLKELKEKYDVGFIIIIGELFGHPKDYAYKVAELFKKHNMLWASGGVRCTSFDHADMEFFKACGCTALKFGIESGSQKILDIMEKRFKVEDIYNALKNAKDLGIFSPLLFCIGMPGETNETIMETGKFLGRVHQMLGVPPLPGAQIFYAVPLPGAPLYEYGRLNGVFGNTIKKEEEILIYFGDSRCMNSEQYINLNGSHRKDIVFWEYILYFEAIKTYYQRPLRHELLNEGVASSPRSLVPKKAGSNRIKIIFKVFNFLRLTIINVRPVSYILNFLIKNEKFAIIIAKIPSAIFYPIIREILYLEYLLLIFKRQLAFYGRCIFRSGKSHNTDWGKTFRDVKRRIENPVSLRIINQELRKSIPPPVSLTEKNQRTLYEGR